MQQWLLERFGPGAQTAWRLLLYFTFLFAFLVVGQYGASLLPRQALHWIGRLVALASALAAAGIILWRFHDRPLGALGLAWTRQAPRDVGSGLIVGGALLLTATAILIVTGTVRFVPDEGALRHYLIALTWSFGFFFLAAAEEEILYRGYPFQALVQWLGVGPAVVGTSAFFSFRHAINPNIDGVAFLNIFLAGVLLALAYLRTRSLWFPTALHAAWNWTMAAVVDLPVSGLVIIDVPLYDAVETGMDWWTGGAFGPEGGLAATVTLLVGIAWTIRTRTLHESPEMRDLRPIVDTRLQRNRVSS